MTADPHAEHVAALAEDVWNDFEGSPSRKPHKHQGERGNDCEICGFGLLNKVHHKHRLRAV